MPGSLSEYIASLPMANLCLCQLVHPSMGAWIGVEINGRAFGCNCPKLSERKEDHCHSQTAIAFLPSAFANHRYSVMCSILGPLLVRIFLETSSSLLLCFLWLSWTESGYLIHINSLISFRQLVTLWGHKWKSSDPWKTNWLYPKFLLHGNQRNKAAELWEANPRFTSPWRERRLDEAGDTVINNVESVSEDLALNPRSAPPHRSPRGLLGSSCAAASELFLCP